MPRATVAEETRNFPYIIAWILFLSSAAVGAGFLLSPEPRKQVLGFALLFAPIVIFGALMGLFYWRSRRLVAQESDDAT